MNQLSQAIILATTAHKNQVDKEGNLHILHPLRVMLQGQGETEMMVGILHEVLEDTYVEHWLLVASFGLEVADAVAALSRREGETYVDFIRRCGALGISRRVKRYDLQDNLSPYRRKGLSVSLELRYRNALEYLDNL